MQEEEFRVEREQRRRKILLGQIKAQEQLDQEYREGLLLTKVARQSKQERRIAEQ
jgi:hypothetical protein